MSWEAAAAIGSLMGGLSGIFGRKKNPSPRDNIMSQAAGARDAAAAYGFNPLTMLQYGNPGGTGLGASGPPLASFDMITQGFKEIGDIASGDVERRREQEQLKHELTKLEVERLRAGRASDALGGSSPLGKTAIPYTTAAGQDWVNPSLGMQEAWPAPGRKVEVETQKNKSGFTTVENKFTGGPVYIWGEEVGEGPLEAAWAGIQMAPQMAWNHVSNMADAGAAARDKYKKEHGETPRETADSWLSPFGIRTFSPVNTIDMDKIHARRKAKGKKP